MTRDQVYVAASWRTSTQPAVVAALRARGLTVYDFRNPPNNSGFGWEEVSDFMRECPTCEGFCVVDTIAADTRCPTCKGTGTVRKKGVEWTPEEYLSALKHPRAVEGYLSDITALTNAYIVVLVQPSGRSAALEFGYACAKGKRTAVLLAPGQEPELMLKMAERFFTDLDALVEWATHIPGL